MNFGVSFQPGAPQTPGQQASAQNALGPSQKALKILALHLPTIAGRSAAPTEAKPAGLSPDQAVFRALVESLNGHPVGGHPTTDPLVETFGSLGPDHLPTSAPTSPSDSGASPGGNYLGPQGEWQPGPHELGPQQDLWSSIVASLGQA